MYTVCSKFAPKNWYTPLYNALLFLCIVLKGSFIDNCFFHERNLLLVLRVGDAGIVISIQSLSGGFIQELRTLDFDFVIEDDFNLSPKSVIKKIIRTTPLEE